MQGLEGGESDEDPAEDVGAQAAAAMDGAEDASEEDDDSDEV